MKFDNIYECLHSKIMVCCDLGARNLDIQGVMHDFEWALINSVERWLCVIIIWDVFSIGNRCFIKTWLTEVLEMRSFQLSCHCLMS